MVVPDLSSGDQWTLYTGNGKIRYQGLSVLADMIVLIQSIPAFTARFVA